jgi:hypothetical protein
MTAAAKRYKYLRRLIKFQQMDFEFAFWQMLYLFIAPQKVYRNFHYRKRKKVLYLWTIFLPSEQCVVWSFFTWLVIISNNSCIRTQRFGTTSSLACHCPEPVSSTTCCHDTSPLYHYNFILPSLLSSKWLICKSFLHQNSACRSFLLSQLHVQPISTSYISLPWKYLVTSRKAMNFLVM